MKTAVREKILTMNTDLIKKERSFILLSRGAVNAILFVLFFLTVANASFAQYPFSLPSNLEASINIQSTSQEKFNNLLLGYNIMDYSTTTEKDLIRLFNPITIRFPHGLFSNWYDWEQDKARVYGTETFSYRKADGTYANKTIDQLSSINTMDNLNLYVGIDGLETLHKEKPGGYDMIWTFNMSADGTDFNNGSPVSVARYQNLVGRGFPVNAVEMGNENFYPGQRSSIIPNTEDYIARAKSMSAALKALDPNIKVSVPMLRRENTANPNWNADLASDLTYFDAVSVHTYVGSDPDDPTTGSGAYATALTAREDLRKSIDDYAGKVAPEKPIWLTEWGVKSGGPNAVSVLGMADCYIFMSQNQNRYERANWFSVNGKLNSFLVWEDYVSPSGVIRPRIKYPLEKTAFASTYEILHSVFENSTLLESSIIAADLITNVDAVSARAVVKDGETTVFVLNLTDQEVPFTVNLDGVEYTGAYLQKAMSFNAMDEERVLPIDTDPLSIIHDGTGAITLPKFSINTIWLKEANVDVVTAAESIKLNGDRLIEIYPNPANETFTIALNGLGKADIAIYNMGGKLMYRKTAEEPKTQIAVGSGYRPGLYLVKVTDEQFGTYCKKLIVR